MYVCIYVCVQKKNLNHTLAAISHRETMVEGLLFSLLTNAPAVEAIGASCTRQFSRQVFYSINAHHLGLEATPILNKGNWKPHPFRILQSTSQVFTGS